MIYGRWLGADATGACLAVVAPRDTPEGYAGTLVGLFTELPRRRVFSETCFRHGGSRKHRRVEGGCADYFLDSYSRLISSRGKATFPCRAVPGALSPRYLFRR